MSLAAAVESSSRCQGESLCFLPEYNVLASFPVLIGGHVGYVIVLFILKAIMKNFAALDLKRPMMFYNALQVFLSGLQAVMLSPHLVNAVFNLNGPYTASIEKWILVHYVTKFLDMFDSFFMVLRKKDAQLSFLHVYHHLTIGLIWGLLLHYGNANGTAFYGAWINSVVHTIMYFHYLWTSLGLKNPLKRFLTQFQMLQFGTCVLHAILALAVEQVLPARWAYLQASYHCTLLYLFSRFYKEMVVRSASPSPDGRKKPVKKAE